MTKGIHPELTTIKLLTLDSINSNYGYNKNWIVFLVDEMAIEEIQKFILK